ncbi:MAG TPA: glycosyltransferase family 39 protein, partial [Sphingobacteriaceae bacterium]
MYYRRHKREIHLILFFVVLKLVLHLLANSRFGFHRDELLYIALGQHLDWGFMEVPPFIAGISWLSQAVFGDSVFAFRILPSLAGAMIVFLVGLMVLVLNGKRPAITMACLAATFSPAFLASGYLLQPVVFDQLFWTAAAFLLVIYIATHKTRYILLLGVVAGLGMMNKYTMAAFLLALLLGILVTPQRKFLWNRNFLYAGGIGLLLFLPNLIWQIRQDLPVIRHLRELKKTQLDYIQPQEFLIQSFVVHGTLGMVAILGLVYILASKRSSRFRFIGIAFILIVALMLQLQGKVYYAFGAFPMLFAAGGMAFQYGARLLSETFVKASMIVLVAPCLLFIPVVIPILPIGTTLQFFELAKTSGLSFPLKWEDQRMHATTQDYGDMFGWQDMADYSVQAYQQIPEHERGNTTVIADNYGQAGALEHLVKDSLPET